MHSVITHKLFTSDKGSGMLFNVVALEIMAKNKVLTYRKGAGFKLGYSQSHDSVFPCKATALFPTQYLACVLFKK